MSNCAYHPDREAVGACVSCGKLVCEGCKTVLGGKIYCNPCADRIFTTRTEAGVSQAAAGAPGAENTSGQGGSAVVPEEIKGWNWGAFLLSWIWGIGNSVWISFLTWVPYIGWVMAFVLGAKGSEWAWRYKRWESVEHFRRTQSTWTKWGVGIVLCSIALSIIIFALITIAESY